MESSPPFPPSVSPGGGVFGTVISETPSASTSFLVPLAILLSLVDWRLAGLEPPPSLSFFVLFVSGLLEPLDALETRDLAPVLGRVDARLFESFGVSKK